jgi:hypothetical protein
MLKSSWEVICVNAELKTSVSEISASIIMANPGDYFYNQSL